jgi:hypothetical protein
MALFEAPIAHEAVHYSSPEIHYSTPEFEYEYEDEAHPYSNPELEYEGLLGNIISGIGGLLGGGEVGQEFEYEYEDEATEEEFEGLLGNILGGIGSLLGGGEIGQEFEDEYEADLFFKRIGRAIKRVSRVVAPIAKRLAPIATRALVGMIPGVGAIAAPLAGQLVGSLVSEAEMEVAAMENHFTNTYAETGEAEHPEVHEALLSELLAANAVGAATEAEAEAEIGATIPLTIRVMRARRVLPVTPALVQANVRLVKTLRRQGQGGRELLRLLPTINRLAVAILNRASRIQRLTSPFAVRAMAVATNRVMRNPRKVRKAVQRNMALRVRAQAARPRGRLPLRPSPRRRQVRI